jgi:hypothetical protein
LGRFTIKAEKSNKSNKIHIKKSYSKITRFKIDPNTLKDEYRDPGARVPVRKQEEFKLPIPGTITSLLKFAPSKKVEKSEINPKDKLSNFL